MEKNRFDLEQEIMDCWQITNAIEDIYNAVGDDPFFEGMTPEHQDKLMNLLLGVKEIYELKFDRTFKTFETCVKNSMVK